MHKREESSQNKMIGDGWNPFRACKIREQSIIPTLPDTAAFLLVLRANKRRLIRYVDEKKIQSHDFKY